MQNINEKLNWLVDDYAVDDKRSFLFAYHPAPVDRFIKNNTVCFFIRCMMGALFIYALSECYLFLVSLNMGWELNYMLSTSDNLYFSSYPVFMVLSVIVVCFMVYLHEVNKRSYLRMKEIRGGEA